MFCPFCGVKNDDGQTQCFICLKRLPSLDFELSPAQQRSRSGPLRISVSAPSTARLGDRFIAVILDTIFISAILLFGAAALFWRWPTILERYTLVSLVVIASIVAVVLVFIYYWLLEGAFGATLGKAIVGVRVSRKEGGVPGMGSSAIRNAFRLIDALPLYLIGFFVAAFSRGRRRLGDYAAGTVVLERTVPWGERAAVVFLWLAGIAAALWGTWLLRPSWFQFPLR
jgi:uncharacterized RDD family membrane protein YckC